MYLTYSEYQSYGGTLTEAEFTRYEFAARKLIDAMTYGRVAAMEEVPEAVKMCILSLVELESSAGAVAQMSSPVVTSFNTDGYSETYGNVLTTEEAQEQKLKIIQSMLYGELDDHGVPLLYRGMHLMRR